MIAIEPPHAFVPYFHLAKDEALWRMFQVIIRKIREHTEMARTTIALNYQSSELLALPPLGLHGVIQWQDAAREFISHGDAQKLISLCEHEGDDGTCLRRIGKRLMWGLITEEERKNVLEETRVARSDQRLLHDAADLW